MKFNNRPNEFVDLIDGRKLWISRAPAVIGHYLCCVKEEGNKELYVLMVKRGKGCPSEVGKWCLPCGFLDWDEDGVDGVIRETWEETGVDANIIEKNAQKKVYSMFTHRQPWRTTTDPQADNMQNICLHFGMSVSLKNLPEIKGPQEGEKDEIDDVKFVNIKDLTNYEIGFNHKHLFEEFMKHVFESNM